MFALFVFYALLDVAIQILLFFSNKREKELNITSSTNFLFWAYILNNLYFQVDAFVHTIVNLKYLKVALQVEAQIKQSKTYHDGVVLWLFIV